MTPDWIAVDWGTTRLRAWAMNGASALARVESDQGMGRLTRDSFKPTLLALIAPWLPLPVIACGMVGAREGWAEAPYGTTPCPPLSNNLTQPDTALDIRIIPGIAQQNPADVMRGEETQIAGFLALNPGWDGTICLPGTHTKWVQVSADEIVSFRTCMTGELFATLRSHTTLRHSTGDGWDDAAFDGGLADGTQRPEWLLARLFSLRAEGLLHGLSPAAASARLSGLLIGAELTAMRAYWLGSQIAVIGESTLARHYIKALAAQGAPATQVDADAATLAGLTAAWRRQKAAT